MKNENNHRRDFLKKITLAGAGLAFINKSFGLENPPAAQSEVLDLKPSTDFTLPPLPYSYDALEPFIDKQTMEIHHTKHHQAYVDKLNAALSDVKITDTSLDGICKNISNYSTAVRNNAGGHYNHSMFWKIMKPNSSSTPNEPSGELADAIKSAFDSFSGFQAKFSEKALATFGSGWAWLLVNKDGKLEIGSSPNQDNPLMSLPVTVPAGKPAQTGVFELKGNPVIGLDVWEHAYYLKYQNKRADYIKAWWNIVNWEEASLRFKNK